MHFLNMFQIQGMSMNEFIQDTLNYIDRMQESEGHIVFFCPEDEDGNPSAAIVVVTGERLESFIRMYRKWEDDYLEVGDE